MCRAWYFYFSPFMHAVQAADDGGGVSVTHKGATKTITQAGECIVCLAECSTKIERVWQGTLVVLRCAVSRRAKRLKQSDVSHDFAPLSPVALPRYVSSGVGDALSAALRADLAHQSAVVLPLARFYPLLDADVDNLCLETDPAVLKGQDEEVYALLCEHFEVTVVTVVYFLVNDVSSACVMGPTTDYCSASAPLTTTSSTTSSTTSASTSTNNSVSSFATAHEEPPIAKKDILIVPVTRGFGRGARMYLGKKTRLDDPDVVTLVTGLHVRMKA